MYLFSHFKIKNEVVGTIYFTSGNSLSLKEALEIRTLTWHAKGLLAYLITIPDTNSVNFQFILKNFPGGRHLLRRIVKELVSHELCEFLEVNKKGDFKKI